MACNNCIHNGLCLGSYNELTDEFENVENCCHFKDEDNFEEVTRCKNCWNSEDVDGVLYCNYFNKNVYEDDFCSNGG